MADRAATPADLPRTPTQLPSPLKGTLVGTIAVIVWATGGPVITFAPGIPPFQLIAMTFVAFFLALLPVWLVRGENIAAKFRMPARVWIVGTLGPWGYTVFFFHSYQLIPPVHASLILMSWPIVLLLANAAFKGRRIRWWHGAGAAAGFLGAAVLVVGRNDGIAGFSDGSIWGYLMAAAGALTFCAYSFARSSWPQVPTDAGALFCLAGAGLALVIHLPLETTVMPDATGWAVVACFGLLSVTVSLYTWDYGMKYGQVRALVSLTYLTPLMTAFILIAIGADQLSTAVATACFLIVGGAFLGSKDMFTRAGRAGADG
ncbi:MAG: DMT family transporter [Proteobacteria bacterium]|nr:DMT family transporter [Pseudomonadota bacterium]